MYRGELSYILKFARQIVCTFLQWDAGRAVLCLTTLVYDI